MSEVEALDRSRRRMLLGLLIGFGVWQSVSIAKALVGGARFPRGVYLGLMAVSLAGGAYWGFELLQMLRWARRVRRNPELAATLNDERVQVVRLKALAVALVAVLTAQAIPILAPIPAVVGGQVTILVGVTVAIGAYLTLDEG